jgi:hypothetical protein
VSLIITAYKTQRRMQSYRSPAIHMAARHYRGDPGIFDSIWSGIKGAAGGFLTGGIGGAILGGAAGIASGNKGKPKNPSIGLGLAGTRFDTSRLALAQPGDTRIFSPGGDISIGGGLPPMLSSPGRGNTTAQGTSGTDWNDRANSLQQACPKGYHANKSGYYSQRYGWVPAGSTCVKNRKRNPLNPRALSRSMARVGSAQKAIKSIVRYESVTRGGRINVGKRPGRKGGCGCK